MSKLRQRDLIDDYIIPEICPICEAAAPNGIIFGMGYGPTRVHYPKCENLLLAEPKGSLLDRINKIRGRREWADSLSQHSCS